MAILVSIEGVMMIQSLLEQFHAVTIYHQIAEHQVVKHLISLLKELDSDSPCFLIILEHYSSICRILYQSEFQGNLCDYLLDQILCDNNVYTTLCAEENQQDIPTIVEQAAAFDLHFFHQLSQISSEILKQKIICWFPGKEKFILQLPSYENQQTIFLSYQRWGEQLQVLRAFHHKQGISIFAKYIAFYISHQNQITPIKQFNPFPLSGLKKYEFQKKQLIDNTLSFLHHQPANHALLYGDRGTGKSTMINAILNEYYGQGLRMIQIAKEDIVQLESILEQVRIIPLRFIFFIDDLTFEENDACFNVLKAILEGSLRGMPKNVLIYATTNRRHLIKETFSSREGNELHASDTRDENASLADRFGLNITFMKPTPEEFISIVLELAEDRGLALDKAVLCKGANIFATKKASRSGRIAKQYIDYIEGRVALNLPI